MKPITIENCACIVGRMHGPRSAWVAREPVSGLAVSNPCDTRKEAIADAARKIQAFGGADRFNAAVRTAKTSRP